MKLKVKSRRGMTLVECIAYLSIMSLLMIIEISLIATMYTNFYSTLNKNKSINSVSNGINNLNKIVREDGITSITYQGNRVKVRKRVDDTVENVKEIYLNNHNLVVDYLTVNNTSVIFETQNTLMINVNAFEVYKKNNLLYLKIESGGDKYIQCI